VALYVDSAERDAIEPLLATGLFTGVATNPALLSRAGLSQRDLPEFYGWAVDRGAGTVFMQTLGSTSEHIAESGRQLRAIGEGVVVKVPATRAGLTAARTLADDEVPILITAVYHASQALLAAAAGAQFIAPYVGRMTDQGRDGVQSAVTIHQVLTGSGTRVLVASLRTLDDVTVLAAAGVPDFALNADLAAALLADELTDRAAADFEAVAMQDATPSGSATDE
jgi:TalC/MipB family fructose-6-phosphate aldolase